MAFSLKSDADWAQMVDLKTPLTPTEFFWVFAAHRSVSLYLVLVVFSLLIALCTVQVWWHAFSASLLVIAAYPIVEFVLHRFVLHSRKLYRSPLTAKLWSRLHYRHHMAPSDLTVLFGAPSATIPTVAFFTLPIGYFTFGSSGAAPAVAMGFCILLVYEFFHCAAHLPVHFNTRIMQRMRRHHALHHFHAENGNYGVVTDLADRMFATAYNSGAERAPSPSVRNLGYDQEETERYPWLSRLTGSPSSRD